MCKTFEEVAMEVIREDWEFRKSQHNASFNQERIARMMGISRSQFAKALGENKNPTISFICRYATAVGRPIDELLHTIGIRDVEKVQGESYRGISFKNGNSPVEGNLNMQLAYEAHEGGRSFTDILHEKLNGIVTHTGCHNSVLSGRIAAALGVAENSCTAFNASF